MKRTPLKRSTKPIKRSPIRKVRATARPDAVLGVVVHKDGREVCQKNMEGLREYKTRTVDMVRRQDYRCAIGNEYIENWTATFDHQAGRGMGGGHRDDRIEIDGEWNNAALCAHCNGLKGSRRYSWIDGKYRPVKQ